MHGDLIPYLVDHLDKISAFVAVLVSGIVAVTATQGRWFASRSDLWKRIVDERVKAGLGLMEAVAKRYNEMQRAVGLLSRLAGSGGNPVVRMQADRQLRDLLSVTADESGGNFNAAAGAAYMFFSVGLKDVVGAFLQTDIDLQMAITVEMTRGSEVRPPSMTAMQVAMDKLILRLRSELRVDQAVEHENRAFDGPWGTRWRRARDRSRR